MKEAGVNQPSEYFICLIGGLAKSPLPGPAAFEEGLFGLPGQNIAGSESTFRNIKSTQKPMGPSTTVLWAHLHNGRAPSLTLERGCGDR